MSNIYAYTSKNTSPASSNGKAQKPKEYDSEYTSLAKKLLNDYIAKDDFDYNVNSDKLYKQYAEKYKKDGDTAMRDTVAQASALSGGYGNSYAVTAGNQAYQGHLDKLNDIVPELEEKAYERYIQKDKDKKDQFDMVNELEEKEYEKYRDSMGDYFTDREFYEDNYRYREDRDVELYKALYDYILENQKMENDYILENRKMDNDYKINMLKAFN